MKRIFPILGLLLFAHLAFSQEQPPYDPAPVPSLMSTYTSTDLGFTISYPKEFTPGTAKDLATVMDRGHREAYGTDPDTDHEHQEVVRCMHPLLYATSASASAPTGGLDSSDTFLVIDFDRSCIPKKLKGDKALTQLVGSVLHLPGATQLVQQMWFVAGDKRRIHAGMAEINIKADTCKDSIKAESSACEIPLFIVAATFEQKNHWVMVTYLSGTAEQKHVMLQHISVSFEDARPILLFPFLFEKVNLIK